MIEIKYPPNTKEYVVSCEFAAKPRRPEDLSTELKDRGVTSRAAFYRVLKRIKKDSVIYPISEQERKTIWVDRQRWKYFEGKILFRQR